MCFQSSDFVSQLGPPPPMFFLVCSMRGQGLQVQGCFVSKDHQKNCKEKAAADLKAKYLVTRLHLTCACYMLQFGETKDHFQIIKLATRTHVFS